MSFSKCQRSTGHGLNFFISLSLSFFAPAFFSEINSAISMILNITYVVSPKCISTIHTFLMNSKFIFPIMSSVVLFLSHRVNLILIPKWILIPSSSLLLRLHPHLVFLVTGTGISLTCLSQLIESNFIHLSYSIDTRVSWITTPTIFDHLFSHLYFKNPNWCFTLPPLVHFPTGQTE